MKVRRPVSFLCAIALFVTTLGSFPLVAVRAQTAARTPSSQEAQQAQQPAAAKRPLAHTDYDSWRSIQAAQISRDGNFVAYAYVPQDGDGHIVVRNVASGAEWRAQIG